MKLHSLRTEQIWEAGVRGWSSAIAADKDTMLKTGSVRESLSWALPLPTLESGTKADRFTLPQHKMGRYFSAPNQQ